MHTHPNVALEIRDPHAEELLINNGDFSAPSSSLMAVNNQQPGMTDLFHLITIASSFLFSVESFPTACCFF